MFLSIVLHLLGFGIGGDYSRPDCRHQHAQHSRALDRRLAELSRRETKPEMSVDSMDTTDTETEPRP